MSGEKNETLRALLERVKGYQMTPEERDEQAVSFAWGNLRLAGRDVTIEDVRAALERVRGRAT